MILKKKCYNNFFLILYLIGFLGCTASEHPPVENPYFTLLSPESTGVTFTNTITETQQFNLFSYRNMYNGGGVGIGDINNDGRLDLYFTSNQGKNKLYLNEGDFTFTDITENAGVAGSAFWSTGVSMVDINNDGYLDIYVLNSGDISGDDRRNELFINQGDSTFVERASAYGLDFNSFSVHATFFDYDGDGDLDCYLLNNSYQGQKPQGWRADTRSIADSLGGDKLLRNDPHPEQDGQRVFTDVSQEAGIHQGELGFGLGVAVGDLNGDNRPDIYVSNDFWERDYLYINQGDGTFSDEIIGAMDHISQSSMGNDIADLNNDGLMDIYVTDMLANTDARLKTMTMFDAYHRDEPKYHEKFHYQYVHNTLQMNDGTGLFSEMAFASGVAATDWSWAPLLFDFDNDGWKDIYVTNGVLRDITDLDFSDFISNRRNIERIVREKGTFNIADFLDRLPSQKIKNVGFVNNRDKTFSEQSDSLGFHTPSFSNGAAYGDLDNDGDLDLVVNNINQPAFIYQNNADQYTNNNYLNVTFEGSPDNVTGIGAKVTIYQDSTLQVVEHQPAKVYQSTLAQGVHFGLGKHRRIDSLKVIWPDGSVEIKKSIKANQTLTLSKRDAGADGEEFNPKIKDSDLLSDVTSIQLEGDITHKEKFVNDFENEPMLPQMLSTLGPAIIKEDFNNDGRIDFWVGGANDSADKIFMQQPDGTFKQTPNPEFEFDRINESTAAATIDMNSDGFPDLLVGSSGYNNPLESGPYALRAYENNGRGYFARRPKWAPKINVSTTVMLADDIDGDGDKDLFIGARVVPKNYGVSPRSYLLRNDGNGTWTDITPKRLKKAGMITDATFTDYNNDGRDELILVGKWMPVMVFKKENGALVFDKQIDESEGWWTSITPIALNGDTGSHFVLGNWGTNSRYSASPEKPLSLHMNDFDGDEQIDFVISSHYMNEQISTPVATYRTLSSEFPAITSRVSSHQQYAYKAIEDIFTDSQLRGVKTKKAVTLQSSILVNKNGSFTIKALPIEAQIAPVYSTITRDFNGDGVTDLLLLGNQYDVKPDVGRLGSNHGVVFLLDENLNSRFVPYGLTGNRIKGEIRDAATFTIDGDGYLLVGRNDANLSLYKMGSLTKSEK